MTFGVESQARRRGDLRNMCRPRDSLRLQIVATKKSKAPSGKAKWPTAECSVGAKRGEDYLVSAPAPLRVFAKPGQSRRSNAAKSKPRERETNSGVETRCRT